MPSIPYTDDARRLTAFYGATGISVETILGALEAEGIDTAHVQASDLYERSLDCQNHGGFAMLPTLADAASEYGQVGPEDSVLDIGCGIGGPGRFLADRLGCSVLGIDLLAPRLEVARALTKLTGLGERLSYRVADATRLPMGGEAFAQAWMLDAGIHVRDKRALFGELARVLRPGGLMVMHDQMGPIPKAMAPMTRRVPYVAPSLPQLLRYVESSGLRVLTWRDTTPSVLEFFERMQTGLRGIPSPAGEASDLGWWREAVDGYVETLGHLGGRTGVLVARRLDG
jgi:ubiquinone/menaquinone biosynthesis C-methylase UbiE